MPNVTLTVSKELKQKMERLPEINWSEVTRQLLEVRIKKEEQLRKLDKLLAGSELTDDDIEDMSKKARAGRYKELKQKGLM